MNKSTKEKLIIVGMPLASVLLTLSMTFFFLLKWWEDIGDKQLAMEEFSSRISVMVDKVNILNKQVTEDLVDYSVGLNIALPHRSVPPVVLASVENEAVRAGLIVDTIYFRGVEKEESAEGAVTATTPDIPVLDTGGETGLPMTDPEFNDGAGSVSVTLNLQGELNQMIEFMNNIQEIRPLLRISYVKVSGNTQQLLMPQEDADAETNVASKLFDINIESPFKSYSTTIGAPSSPVKDISDSDKKTLKEVFEYTSIYDQATIDPKDQFTTGRESPF